MKLTIYPVFRLMALLFIFIVFSAKIIAQAFESGSDGSMGVLVVTEDTELALPPDGIFHYTTIDIAEGATLTFVPNELNTPVHLLATGDVTINGTIDVSGEDSDVGRYGRGGPGGFDGGRPGMNATGEGDGHGPGGGKGGIPIFSSLEGGDAVSGGIYSVNEVTMGDPLNRGSVYGNSLILPLIGGSGGGGMTDTQGGSGFGPGTGGGGGGGAILIASSSRITIDGAVVSIGGRPLPFSNNHGAGSGGAVRLVSPWVTGSGLVDVSGWDAPGLRVMSGDGRIRVDALDISDWGIVSRGLFSMGQEMIVFPESSASLSIVEAAGQSIAEGAGSAVTVNLAEGSSIVQTVIVQARDFEAAISLQIVVTPDSGESTVYDAEIDMATNPDTVSVDVELTPGTPNHIHAWAR